ncbi:NAD-dependent epimerase/dehydratase family protein [Bradyrhizobium sp. SYSU BS000235]|uniref:NAD-dependent epimerase/dehydratase family protein n=1 Tax=Bradyrhizobium sp. SYSU BS000235 TaxID=3411332 RepID=UPI003C718E08
MTMQRLVITGKSGFVGQNLARYLQGRYRLASIGRGPSTAVSQDDYCQWDDLSTDFLNDATAVIHLAGKAHDVRGTSNADEYFASNTELTSRLFDLFLQSTARDFVFFSSVKAIADEVSDVLYETAEPSPQTPYGRSKLAAEQYIAGRQLPSGKRVFILRPSMIHGPGNRGNLNLLYRFVRSGIPYPLAAFQNKRSFLSVENLCFAVAALLEHPSIPGGPYQLADDDALSTTEVVRLIAEGLHRTSRLWSLPPRLLQTAARAGDTLRLPLNTDRLRKLTENYVVDNHKIKDALKIQSFPVEAREGLLKTIRSFE